MTIDAAGRIISECDSALLENKGKYLIKQMMNKNNIVLTTTKEI